jgi:predicted RNase H-like HicB family nuclease
MKYAIILEMSDTGFSAWSPDLPGCVSAGDTPEDTESNMREAIASHIALMRQEGMPVPLPVTRVGYVEVAA